MVFFFPDQKLHRDIYVEMDVTAQRQEAYNAIGYLDVPKGFQLLSRCTFLDEIDF